MTVSRCYLTHKNTSNHRAMLNNLTELALLLMIIYGK